MPALLPEDLGLFMDAGEKHGVEIHAHQIEKIAPVAAGDRIAGLVRERQRVQKRIQRALHQLDERLFNREMLRAAQDGVLQNVKDTRIVERKRPESGAEGLVFVLPFEPAQPRAGSGVGILVQNGVQLADAALPRLFKSMQCRHRGISFLCFPHHTTFRQLPQWKTLRKVSPCNQGEALG